MRILNELNSIAGGIVVGETFGPGWGVTTWEIMRDIPNAASGEPADFGTGVDFINPPDVYGDE